MQKSGFAGAKRGALIALMTMTTIVSGCGGGGGGGSSSGATSGSGASGGNTAPTIGGQPPAQATVGTAYDLTPSARDADGDTLAFSIENRPSWAAFSTATGKLSGTPSTAHLGTTSGIVISVSDGKTSVALPTFSITVAAAGSTGPVPANAIALSWDVPTETMTGATLGDLTGYRIHYGHNANALTRAIEVPSAGNNTFVVRDLRPGTYFFAVRAVAENGESRLSNVISRRIS